MKKNYVRLEKGLWNIEFEKKKWKIMKSGGGGQIAA